MRFSHTPSLARSLFSIGFLLPSMLCLMLSSSANAQSQERENLTAEQSIAAPVEPNEFELGFDYYGRIAVLPPTNQGDETYDWVSIAIQDAMTQDLWQVEAFEARSLRTFSGKFSEHCPTLELNCVVHSDTTALLNAVQDQHLTYALSGTYFVEQEQVQLTLNWHSMRESSETLEGTSTISVTSTLPNLTTSLSAALIDWLHLRGIELPDDRSDRIRRYKTKVTESLMHAAQAYWAQQQYQIDPNDQLLNQWATAALTAIDEDELHPQAWTLLGWRYQKSQEMEAAQHAFKQAIALNNTHLDALAGMVFVQPDTPEGEKLQLQYSVAAAQLNRGVSVYQGNAFVRLTDEGHHRQAIEYAEKEIATSNIIFKQSTLNTASTHNYLGTVYSKLNYNFAALRHFQKALITRTKLLGEEHLSVADIHNALGNLYIRQSNYAAALEHFQKSLPAKLQSLGEEHIDIATLRKNLGDINLKLGDYPAALVQYQLALTTRIELHGKEHTIVAEVHDSLGKTLSAIDDYTAALYHFKQALSIDISLLGNFTAASPLATIV